MNILLVASDNNVASGAFNSMVFLAKELKKNGNNVYVTIPCKGNGEKLLKENDINYLFVKSYNWIGKTYNDRITKLKNIIKKVRLIYNVLPYFKYKQIIKKYNIDIVHNNTVYTYIAALAAKSCNKKLVWHIREFLEEDQNSKFLLKNYSIRLLNQSDKIICISHTIYDKYSKILNENKLEIVYNGIDINKYYVEREILQNKKVRMLCVGGVTEKKGQFDLVDSLGKFYKNNKLDFELKLVGNYDKKAALRIKELEQKYNIFVELCGKQDNTPKFYKNADIVYMCSVSEAFGRVTVEGMLSGALIIGKNCAATCELLQNNKTGLLYYNTNDLVEKIKYVYDNIDVCKMIAKNGQKDASKRFTSEINGREINEIYKNLIK